MSTVSVNVQPIARTRNRISSATTSGEHRTSILQVRDEPVRRVINVAAAAVGIVVAAPIMLLVAAAVKVSSPGPIIYTQTRVGLDRRQVRGAPPRSRRDSDIGGRPFAIYKFRTMCVDAEQGGNAVWAAKNDPRITPIGNFLRSTRLDELPQLYNVLLGDMNIVGPRPERPQIFARLREDIDQYQLRQIARPGITGLAQINQSYDTCVDDVRRKVAYDLEYVRHTSWVDDVIIMLKTVPVMLWRKGGW